MKQSENITELLNALAEIQNELPTMPKNSKAYGYNYTDLDTITQVIKPILHKHNVGYLQSVGIENGLQTLTTRVFSTKGEWIEDTTILPVINGTKNNAAQTLGMSITYMRRYMLSAMLGITSDEDIDASNFIQNQRITNQSKQSQNQQSNYNQNRNPQIQNNQQQIFSADQMVDAKLSLEAFIKNGVLDKNEKFKQTAEDLLQSNDFKRISDAIAYCKGLSEVN